MRRGDLYRVFKGSTTDAKKYRIFVVISRDALIKSQHSTVICAPIYSSYHGLSTQVPLDEQDGLKKSSSIHCDELISIPKSKLTFYISALNTTKIDEMNDCLAISVGIN